MKRPGAEAQLMNDGSLAIRDVTVRFGGLTALDGVSLTAAPRQITGTASEQAVAQIVTTVVNENGLGTGVVFEIDGTHTSVPIANGAEVAGPVYLLDVTA